MDTKTHTRCKKEEYSITSVYLYQNISMKVFKRRFLTRNPWHVLNAGRIFYSARHAELRIDKRPCENHLQSVTIVTALL